MELLLEFFKIHYNFAAIAIIIALFGIFKLSQGNVKGFLIVMGVFLAYNISLKTMVNRNPLWFEEAMESASEFNFVDKIWGGSAVSKSVKKSESRGSGN